MGPIKRQTWNAVCFGLVALLGVGLALGLDDVWDLDTRWIGIVFGAIAAVAVTFCFVRVFSDFLLVVLLLSLPLAAFCKWFWPSSIPIDQYGELVMVGAFGVGLIDFLLAGLYMSWFYRIFVTREEPLPRLDVLDFFIAWWILAYLLALIGCKNPEVALGSTEYLIKHAAFYFYLSRHIEERHLFWLLASIVITVFIEASLGAYQFSTGQLLGLALDKGAGNEAVLAFRNEVPGTEGYNLATGTTLDSHVLGNIMSMMLPFAMVLFFTPVRMIVKLACLAVGACALSVILLTLDRSAWLGTAISLPIGVTLIIILWRERSVMPALAVAVILVALAAPFLADYIYERFARSPIETLTVRYQQWELAWDIFTRFPLFGIGPGNWISVWKQYDWNWFDYDPAFNLVHNVILWNAVELGIFGAIPYLVILAIPLLRLFMLALRRSDLAGRLALAAMTGLLATILHGLADGAFRDPNVFMMFWVLVSLSAALPRLRPGAGNILMAPPKPVRRPATGELGVAPAGATR